MRTHALLGALAVTALAACGGSSPSSAGSGLSSSPQAPAATPTSPPAPIVSLTPIPTHTRCTGHRFGAPLAPLNPPYNLHVYPGSPPMEIDQSRLYEATITTARGVMVLCLDPKLAPHTVNNFVALSRNHFYDGLTFHRVVPGFLIQGGDPSGNRAGPSGPGYTFDNEPVEGAYTDGCVAMANTGPDTNGSQFFICIADDSSELQPYYNLFGYVTSGLEVAHATQVGDVMTSVTVAVQAD
jgi:cyclophilin family peptidyl-prolyl cis-trans isomerase